MTITATVSTTTKLSYFGHTIFHYVILLSNGVCVKRQAKNGAQGVAFSLELPGETTASKNIKRLISKFRNQTDYVVVNLETEEVIVCG